MSATAAGGPFETPSTVWLAHHHLKLGMASVPLHVASWFLLSYTVAWWAIVLPACALFSGFVVGLGLSRMHLGLTCEHCMQRFTTDGAAEAVRRRRALRLAHRSHTGKEAIVLLTLFFLTPGLAAWTGLPWLALLSPLFFPWMVWNAWLARVHGRIQPWCPQCRNDGRGDRDSAPTPRPVPHGVAS